MLHKGAPPRSVSAHPISALRLPRFRMSAFRLSAPDVAALFVGFALLTNPGIVLAQRGGGGGGGGHGISTGISGGVVGNRPDGVSEKDDLKDFHRAMAIQATPEQRAAFAKVAQHAQAAIDQLKAFRESLQKAPASSPVVHAPTVDASTVDVSTRDRATTLDQAIANARGSSQNFLTSFSAKQKSGLQDTTKKLEKADSELDKQVKMLNQVVQTPKSDTEQISSSSAALDKALASFQNEQLALGREMSILFDPAGQGVTFSLPAVTSSIDMAGQTISFPASGAVSRTSAENGQNLFNLKVVADLSDLQQNIRGILRSEVTRSPRCGERIEILEATLTPLEPASQVVAKLHFERWVCVTGQSPMEVAGGDAEIEIKLTPSVEPATGLHLVPEITHVEAQGLLRDSLRSGDLGVTLRDQIAASIFSALQKGADLKAALPPAAQQSATLQKALFQDDGADQLSLVLDGKLQFSDEQTQQFAAQLKQRLAAQSQGQRTTPQ
jgi:hypothetical protein